MPDARVGVPRTSFIFPSSTTSTIDFSTQQLTSKYTTVLMSNQDNPGNILKADPPGVDLQHPRPSPPVNVSSVLVTDPSMPPPSKGPLGKDLSYAPPISYRSISTLPESTLIHRVPSCLRKISELKVPPLSLGIVKMSDGKYQKSQGKLDRKHNPLSSNTVSRLVSPADPIENWSHPSPSSSSGLPIPIPLTVSYPVPLHLPPGPERDEYLRKEIAVSNVVMKQMDIDEAENPDVFNSFHQRTLDRFAHHLLTPTPPPHSETSPNRKESHSVTPTNKSAQPQNLASPTPSCPEDPAINYHNPVTRSPSLPLAYDGNSSSSPIPAVKTVQLAMAMMAEDFFIKEMNKVNDGAISPALPVIALVSLSIHDSCSTLSFHFPLSSYDSHQATGRQDCYCSLERRPTTPTADEKDQLHSQRPSNLVPQDQDSLPCPPPPPPLPKPWRPSHPNGHQRMPLEHRP